MKVDVSLMRYGEIKSALENFPFKVQQLSRHGDRVLLECAAPI